MLERDGRDDEEEEGHRPDGARGRLLGLNHVALDCYQLHCPRSDRDGDDDDDDIDAAAVTITADGG